MSSKNFPLLDEACENLAVSHTSSFPKPLNETKLWIVKYHNVNINLLISPSWYCDRRLCTQMPPQTNSSWRDLYQQGRVRSAQENLQHLDRKRLEGKQLRIAQQSSLRLLHKWEPISSDPPLRGINTACPYNTKTHWPHSTMSTDWSQNTFPFCFLIYLHPEWL